MNEFIKHVRLSALAALIITGAMVGGAIVFAQEAANNAASVHETNKESAGITFPVAELDNCASREECHAYCEQGGHMEQCIAFAKAHGLMNKEEAERSEKFSQRLKEKKTPGGCDSHESCNAYCENIAHIDECVAFAEQHDFKGEEYARGKRLGAYLKKGGTMPGGCTSRASCDAYCSDFTHAEECYQFAENAGVADDMGDVDVKGGRAQKMSPEHLKRLGELSQKGETPGGCMNKDACMAYCQVEGHMEECIAFGEKVGFMKKEEAERARTFMSKGGPGGCNSEEACHAFCNDPANQEACFSFAEQNGLIPKEKISEMKQGWVRMRQGVENAPKEVQDCLASTLGTNIIADIESGKLVPGPAIGERMRSCFEKFGGNHDPGREFMKAPPEVTACLKEKLGDQFADLRSGKTMPTPEIADQFRVCFQQMQITHGAWGGPQGEQGAGGHPGMRGGEQGMPSLEKIQSYFKGFPPEVAACMKEKLGADFDKLQTGEMQPTPDLGEKMKACFGAFHPMMNDGGQGGMPRPSEGMPPSMPNTQQFPSNLPSEVTLCLKEKLGADAFAKLGQSQLTPEEDQLVHSCFSMIKGTGVMPTPPSATNMPPLPPPPSEGSAGVTGWVSHLPANIQACLQEKYGADKLRALNMAPPTPEVGMVIKACFTISAGTPITPDMYPAPTNTGAMPPPPTMEGAPMPATMMPPPPPPTATAPQSRSFIQSMLGAVASPFVHFWSIVR